MIDKKRICEIVINYLKNNYQNISFLFGKVAGSTLISTKRNLFITSWKTIFGYRFLCSMKSFLDFRRHFSTTRKPRGSKDQLVDWFPQLETEAVKSFVKSDINGFTDIRFVGLVFNVPRCFNQIKF